MEFYHHAVRPGPWEDAEAGDGADERLFSSSRWTLECPDPRPGAAPLLRREGVNGEVQRYPVREAFSRFRLFSSDDGTENYTFFYYLFKFLGLVIAAGAYIPYPLVEGDTLKVIWLPFEGVPAIREALDGLARHESRMLPLERPAKKRGPEKAAGAAGTRPAAAERAAAKKTEPPVYASGRTVVNLIAQALLTEEVRRTYFSRNGVKGGDAAFRALVDLFFSGGKITVSSPALRSLPFSIANWLSVLHLDFSAHRYRFTLKASAKGGFGLSVDLLLQTAEGTEAVPLKDAAAKTGSIAVLRAPTALSNYLPELRTLFTKPRVPLAEDRLVRFLDDAAGLMTRLGIEVVFPKNLHRELKPRLVLAGDAKKTGALVSYLSLDKLLEWRWEVAIGDEVLSPEEFAALAAQKKDLVLFRDKYIRLDPAEAARLFRQVKTGAPVTAGDFLKAYFAGDSLLSFDAEEIIQRQTILSPSARTKLSPLP